MTNRLYGFNYNKEQWTIKNYRFNGYRIINNSTRDFVELNDNVVGIEQISDDNFIINASQHGGLSKFSRIKVSGSNAMEIFSKRFNYFAFLTDDTILFDGSFVYSISKNAEVEEFKWIKPRYEISVHTTENSKKAILVKCPILSIELPHLYVMVIVDGETFKPISQAFSSLRCSLITLTDDFTFNMLVEEDENYARIASDIIFSDDMIINEKGCSTLYTQVPIKK